MKRKLKRPGRGLLALAVIVAPCALALLRGIRRRDIDVVLHCAERIVHCDIVHRSLASSKHHLRVVPKVSRRFQDTGCGSSQVSAPVSIRVA